MPSQRQIEIAAGIDETVAKYLMATEPTPVAKQALSLLKMCVDCFEMGAFTLLECTISSIKEEIKNKEFE